MRHRLYFFLILFLGIQLTAEAQILKKLKAAVKEAAVEVLEEELDTNPQKHAQKQEKKAPVATSSGNLGTQISSPPTKQTLAKGKNVFESNTTREIYGEIGEFVLLSPDGGYVAHSGFEGSRQVIFINGKPGPSFDKIRTEFFTFSPSGGNHAYFGQRDGACILMIDGKETATLPCDFIDLRELHKNMVFSEDGSMYSYPAKTLQGRWQVFINGDAGPELSAVNSLEIEGKDVFFKASEDHMKTLYKNNKVIEGPVSGKILKSRDGTVWALIRPEISSVEKWVAVKGERLAEICFNCTFSLDEKSGAGFISGSGQNKLIWRGKVFPLPEGEFFSIPEYKQPVTMAMSPDRKRLAFVTEKGDTKRVWLDHQAGPFYQDVRDLKFTGDSKTLIYLADAGDKTFVVANGVEQGPFDGTDQLQVSKAGMGYTFLVNEEGIPVRYINGKRWGAAKTPKAFVFNADGSRHAFYVDRESYFVVDGEKISPPGFKWMEIFVEGNIRPPEPALFVFSPAGNRLAYTYMRETEDRKKQAVLVLDDQQLITEYGYGDFGYPTFNANGTHFAHLQRIKGENDLDLWQLFIDLKPGPVVGEVKVPNTINKQVSLKFIDNSTVQVIGFLKGQIVAHKISL